MDKNLQKEIGERLRKERTRLDFSQEYMSEKMGISLTFYGDIERGNKGMSAETLYKLKTNLGINIDYLLTGDVSGSINDTFNKLKDLSPKKSKYFQDVVQIFTEMNEL